MVITAIYILVWVLTLAFGIGVVAARRADHSAFNLMGVMVGLAANFLLTGFQFIGFLQVIVYIGAIMVLFLFVIMLLNVQIETKLAGIWGFMRYAAIGIFAVIFLQLGYFGLQTFFIAEPETVLVKETTVGTVESIGFALFNEYVLAFEIASILLLTAMLGAIYLSKSKLTLGEDGTAKRRLHAKGGSDHEDAENLVKEH